LKSLKLCLINVVTRKRARKQDKHSMAVRICVFTLLKETGLNDQQQPGTLNLNLRPQYCSAQSSLPLENLSHTMLCVCVCVQAEGKLPDIVLYCE